MTPSEEKRPRRKKLDEEDAKKQALSDYKNSKLEMALKIKRGREAIRKLEREYDREYGGKNRYLTTGFIVGFIVGCMVASIVVKLGLTG